MDDMLMLLGQERHCADCGTVTIFLPVDPDEAHRAGTEWVCTACDGAVVVLAA